MARSDDSAAAVEARGAEVLQGDLDDLDALRRGSAGAEAVIHLANKHDCPTLPSQAGPSGWQSRRSLRHSSARAGRFVFASGVAGLTPGRPSNEADPATAIGPNSPRGGAEHRAFGFIDQGVRAISARFSPTVHGMRDHGFIAYIADVARRTGSSAYVGDGGNAWAAVHVGDAARLVRLGLERAPAGARLHAVGEDAVPTRKIAEAIGARLGLPTSSVRPEDALNHFGFIGQFFGMDLSSSSAFTQAVYDWKPTGRTLLEDIAQGAYDAA